MRRRRSRWCEERGQSTALVTSMLFVLVLFVSVVANVGQAVNRRIALQVVADAGAYTGASVMATGMNQLAFWNAALQYTWSAFTVFVPFINPVYLPFLMEQNNLGLIPSTFCDASEPWIGFWQGVRRTIDVVYQAENIGYGLLAHSEAEEASDFNAEDLFPGEQLEYAEFDQLSDALGNVFGAIPPARLPYQLDESPMVDDGLIPKAVTVLRWLPSGLMVKSQRHITYTCLEIIELPPFVIYRRIPHDFVTWYRHGDEVTSFVWMVKAPAVKALMFDSVFGGTAIPEMQAAAVAKPIGGELEGGDWTYVAKMMPVASVMAGNQALGSFLPGWLAGWTTGQVGLRDGRIVTH